MTKKDFEVVAHALRVAIGIPSSGGRIGQKRINTILSFADALDREYHNFDRDRFFVACTTGGEYDYFRPDEEGW